MTNSRRDFLIKGSAGVMTGILGATISQGESNTPHLFGSHSSIELAPLDKQPSDLPIEDTDKNQAGWAIVGLGALALEQILPAFAVAKRSSPVALVSGHPDKAKKVAKQYDINPQSLYTYDSFDSMKDNDDIDIVYIVLPNSMHAEYTIRALEAGKHVLCEKPMAVTSREAQKMVDAAKSADRKLMIAYRLRYEPFNQKMIELARAKEFGEIRMITADNGQDIKAPNIRLSKTLGGGPLGDVGIYCLNAVRYITGEEPIEVQAMMTQPSKDPRFAEVPDRVTFQLKFASGILANCFAGFSMGTERRYQVYCEKGSFGLDPAFSYSGLEAFTSDKDGKKKLHIEAANHFASEMDHFSECVLNDTEPTTGGEEGLKDMQIIEKINESIESGKRVTL